MAFNDDDNGQMLAAMADSGMDLTQELDIDFFLTFDDQMDAEAALEEQVAASSKAELHLNDESGLWEITLTVVMVPEYDSIVSQEIALDKFAKEFSGNSDGWGVMQQQDGDDEFADDSHECSEDCQH